MLHVFLGTLLGQCTLVTTRNSVTPSFGALHRPAALLADFWLRLLKPAGKQPAFSMRTCKLYSELKGFMETEPAG
jgi:hypothetical protein